MHMCCGLSLRTIKRKYGLVDKNVDNSLKLGIIRFVGKGDTNKVNVFSLWISFCSHLSKE